ncbi:MAG: hypothetical protein AAF493_22655 [Pseudomonadota bacterium]
MRRSLTVDKKPFLTALKSLRISIRARQKDEAVIGYSDGHVSIELQGQIVNVPAKGEWPGCARVIARTLIPIATFPPDPDPLPLRFENDRFYIAGWSVNASWQDVGDRPLALPDDAGCLEVLMIGRQHTDKALSEAGLLSHVRNTEQFVRTRLAQAAAVLEPIGIEEADLNRIVEEKVAELIRRG